MYSSIKLMGSLSFECCKLRLRAKNVSEAEYEKFQWRLEPKLHSTAMENQLSCIHKLSEIGFRRIDHDSPQLAETPKEHAEEQIFQKVFGKINNRISYKESLTST